MDRQTNSVGSDQTPLIRVYTIYHSSSNINTFRGTGNKIQSNLNALNIFATMEIHSRHG